MREKLEDVQKYHVKADAYVELALSKARDLGIPVACTHCTKPACCKQQIRAYDREVYHIAAVIQHDLPAPLRETVTKQVWRWANWFSRLKLEDQVDQAYSFKKDVYCPLLVDGKCSVYDARPLVCRGHIVLEEDEEPCNNPEAVNVRTVNTLAIHEPPLRQESGVYVLGVALATLLTKGKVSAKFLRVTDRVSRALAEKGMEESLGDTAVAHINDLEDFDNLQDATRLVDLINTAREEDECHAE
jgi:Fe-S-cluster containining protein